MDYLLLFLFHKYEIDSGNQAKECYKVIPMERLPREHTLGDDGENDKTGHFLYYLQLNKSEWSAIINESYTVCRYLTAVLKECYSP